MILAEISDKLWSASFYFGAAILSGVCAAIAVIFSRGQGRIFALGIVASVTAFLAWALQIDSDILKSAQKEMSPMHRISFQYWFLRAIAIAQIFSLIFWKNFTRFHTHNKT
jgi:hypothetical protein